MMTPAYREFSDACRDAFEQRRRAERAEARIAELEDALREIVDVSRRVTAAPRAMVIRDIAEKVLR